MSHSPTRNLARTKTIHKPLQATTFSLLSHAPTHNASKKTTPTPPEDTTDTTIHVSTPPGGRRGVTMERAPFQPQLIRTPLPGALIVPGLREQKDKRRATQKGTCAGTQRELESVQ